MEVLDYRTIIINLSVANGLLFILSLWIWSENHTRFRGVNHWLANAFMQLVGHILLPLNGTIPDYLSFVVGNTCIMGGTLLLYLGLGRFAEIKTEKVFNILYLVAFFCSFFYFTEIDPNLPARILIFSFSISLYTAQTAYILIARTGKNRTIYRGVARVFFFFALLYLIRMGNTITHFSDFLTTDYPNENITADTVIIMTSQLFSIVLILSLLLMINTRLFAEIQQYSNEISASNTTLQRMMRTIAHDFRAPLGSVVNYINMIRQRIDEEKPDKIKEMLSLLSNQSNSIYSQMDNLLLWVKNRDHALPLNFGEIPVANILEDSLALLEGLAKSKNITIDTTYSTEENSLIYADYITAAIIIRNVLSNAIKFSPFDGTIEIEVTRENALLTVTVKDRGAGMPIDLINAISSGEDITPERGTDNEKGSGIGLKLVNEFIQKNNGKLHIQGLPQGGTAVAITFPSV